jgi:hypothetical protein
MIKNLNQSIKNLLILQIYHYYICFELIYFIIIKNFLINIKILYSLFINRIELNN